MDLQSRKDSAMNEVIVNGIDLTPPTPDTLRPGLETLVFLLKNPHMLFGWPSERPADCRWPIDWDLVRERLHRILARSTTSKPDSICADCIWNIRLSARFLREKEISICKGTFGIRFWDDECGDPHVSLELNIDVPRAKLGDLNMANGLYAVRQRYPISGIHLEFTSPRYQVEDRQSEVLSGEPPCPSKQET